MNRREAAKLETRQLILDAARNLFLTRGVETCTLREIAKAAGVSPASLVVHFKSKTALMETALYADIERNIGQAIATLPPEGDLHARIMHIWQAMFFFYDQNRDLYRTLIGNTVYQPDAESPHLAQQMNAFLEFVITMLQQEKELGNVYAHVDAKIAAYNFTALYFLALMGFFRDPTLSPQTAIATLGEMVQQYMEGIMTQGRQHGCRSQTL
jgi:AcrR family transcriptional regulator